MKRVDNLLRPNGLTRVFRIWEVIDGNLAKQKNKDNVDLPQERLATAFSEVRPCDDG
jgi:hypothetical protein